MLCSVLPQFSSYSVDLAGIVKHNKLGGTFAVVDPNDGRPIREHTDIIAAVGGLTEGNLVFAELLAPPMRFPGFSIRGRVYRDDLEKMVPPGATVAIYGSRAGGYHTEQSDLDVMYAQCSKEFDWARWDIAFLKYRCHLPQGPKRIRVFPLRYPNCEG